MREKNPELRSDLEKKDSIEFNPETFKSDEQKARYIADLFETYSKTLDLNWIVVSSDIAAKLALPELAVFPDYEDDLKAIAIKGNLRLYEDRKLPLNSFRTSFDLKSKQK